MTITFPDWNDTDDKKLHPRGKAGRVAQHESLLCYRKAKHLKECKLSTIALSLGSPIGRERPDLLGRKIARKHFLTLETSVGLRFHDDLLQVLQKWCDFTNKETGVLTPKDNFAEKATKILRNSLLKVERSAEHSDLERVECVVAMMALITKFSPGFIRQITRDERLRRDFEQLCFHLAQIYKENDCFFNFVDSVTFQGILEVTCNFGLMAASMIHPFYPLVHSSHLTWQGPPRTGHSPSGRTVSPDGIALARDVVVSPAGSSLVGEAVTPSSHVHMTGEEPEPELAAGPYRDPNKSYMSYETVGTDHQPLFEDQESVLPNIGFGDPSSAFAPVAIGGAAATGSRLGTNDVDGSEQEAQELDLFLDLCKKYLPHRVHEIYGDLVGTFDDWDDGDLSMSGSEGSQDESDDGGKVRSDEDSD